MEGQKFYWTCVKKHKGFGGHNLINPTGIPYVKGLIPFLWERDTQKIDNQSLTGSPK